MSKTKRVKRHTDIAGNGQWLFRVTDIIQEVQDDIHIPPNNTSNKYLYTEVLFEIYGQNNELKQVKVKTIEPIEFTT